MPTLKDKAQFYIDRNEYGQEGSDFHLFLRAALIFDTLVEKLQKAVRIADMDGYGSTLQTLDLLNEAEQIQYECEATQVCEKCHGTGIVKIEFAPGYSNDELCGKCNGSGLVKAKQICSNCEGSGVDGDLHDIFECGKCNGKGVILEDGSVWECNRCDGKGTE